MKAITPDEINFSERFGKLTKRERQVTDMVVDGMTSPEIAQKFCVSPRTVELHRARILAKLSCRSAVVLAAKLTRHRCRLECESPNEQA
jgi:DNA-binding NarL/FixJ family response regulator